MPWIRRSWIWRWAPARQRRIALGSLRRPHERCRPLQRLRGLSIDGRGAADSGTVRQARAPAHPLDRGDGHLRPALRLAIDHLEQRDVDHADRLDRPELDRR